MLLVTPVFNKSKCLVWKGSVWFPWSCGQATKRNRFSCLISCVTFATNSSLHLCSVTIATATAWFGYITGCTTQSCREVTVCSHLPHVVTAVGVGSAVRKQPWTLQGSYVFVTSRPDSEILTSLGTSQIPTDSHTHTTVHCNASTCIFVCWLLSVCVFTSILQL